MDFHKTVRALSAFLGRKSHLGKGLGSLVGLRRIKSLSARDIIACLRANEIFPHTGLWGPGGLGKTSVAEAIAYDLNYWFAMMEGAMVRTRGQMLQRLQNASEEAEIYNKPLLFFIDEAHRLPSECQEALYYPLKEWFIPEYSADLPPFTMFAATTHPHVLLKPFVSRIRNKWYLDRYNDKDIGCILANEFNKFGLDYSPDVEKVIAQRCLGIPRLATDLAMKVRNEVLYRGGEKRITMQDCENTFGLEGIDEIGLNIDQVKYLLVLHEAKGVPKGVGGLAGALGRDAAVVEDSIEPVLLSLRFIDRTSRGRILTAKGRKHLIQTNKIILNAPQLDFCAVAEYSR